MRKLSEHAQAAKLIRTELKKAFPEIKFYVTSESYSGGNSVSIEYIDGPTQKQIQEIVDKYEYGHFDGMYDIYEYSNNRNDIPQVKYVQIQREISENIKNIMLDQWFSFFEGFEKIEGEVNKFIQNGNILYTLQESWRYLNKLDLRFQITRDRIFQSQY